MGLKVGSLAKKLGCINVLVEMVDERRVGGIGTTVELNLPIHAELHFLFVVRNRSVDFVELFANFLVYVPAYGGADHASAEMVVACFGVAQHDGEVFGDVV